MGFTSIATYSYRNLQDQRVPLKARRIFLVGENGQGKSNFLEAVYLLSYGSSFRTKRDNELITHGKKEMALHGRYIRPEEDDIEGTIALKLGGGRNETTTRSSASATADTKIIELDGTRVQDRKQLISHLPAIVFSHDDIAFVNGPPERRRWFFNQTMSLFDPLFIDTLRNYRKILKMRNTALKQQRRDLIPIYDQQLAAAGLLIQQRRTALIAEFNKVVAPIFAQVSTISDPLSIEYRPSWPMLSDLTSPGTSDIPLTPGATGEQAGSPETEPDAHPATPHSAPLDEVLAVLEEKREQDLLYGTTTSGPHRDRFVFRLAGKDFARIASTGQLRLMSLILRIGQSRYFSQKTGRRPILLLDDVLLELDGERRKRFLAQLPDYEQAFFTFLPDEKYLDLASADSHFDPQAEYQPTEARETRDKTGERAYNELTTAIYRVENGWIRKTSTTENTPIEGTSNTRKSTPTTTEPPPTRNT